MWNDPALNIDWRIKNEIISNKDQNSQSFDNFQTKFQ